MADRFISPGDEPNAEEREMLYLIAEECDEIGQRCMKALRFGLTEIQPGTDSSNRHRIAGEIGDLLAAVDLAVERGVISQVVIDNARLAKPARIRKFAQRITFQEATNS